MSYLSGLKVASGIVSDIISGLTLVALSYESTEMGLADVFGDDLDTVSVCRLES